MPETADFYVNEKSTSLTYKKNEDKNKDQVKTLAPVSKKGNEVWNYISQEHAEKVAKNMVKDNASVQSYLIDSHAWNTICRLIKKNNGGKDEKLLNSTMWGNYYNNDITKYEKIKGLYAVHTNDGAWHIAANYSTGTIPNGSALK